MSLGKGTLRETPSNKRFVRPCLNLMCRLEQSKAADHWKSERREMGARMGLEAMVEGGDEF